MNSSFRSILVASLLLLTACPSLRAFDGMSSFVLDFPFKANEATPLWLGHPETPETNFASLDLPISVTDPNASLLVTVFFQDKTSGFLRVTWQGAGTSQVLSDNFYEGIGITNQRSLLISPSTLHGDGKLCFQSADAALGITRIKLEWLEYRNGLVSPEVPDLLVTPVTRQTQTEKSVNGQTQTPDPAAWHNQVVTVPLTDVPLRIEEGVEFAVQLDRVPATGRLGLKEAGLPWGKHMVVWINQHRAGTITPTVPDLRDDGFLTDSPKVYTGWREGSFYAPGSLFKTGVNTIQFSDEDETPSQNADSAVSASEPLAIKDTVLQFNYPAETQDTSSAADAPTGLVTPADSTQDTPPTNTP